MTVSIPHTVGGAERWYRNLAERLAADGHTVTYLTLRQWGRGEDSGLDGVDVRIVGPRMLSTRPRGTGGSCRRWCSAPASFGISCATGADTTSFTPVRFPISRCSRRHWRGHSADTASLWTGSRCGAAATGASTWAAPPGISGGSCRGCVLAFPSAHSAFRGSTPSACLKRGCGARSRCSPGPTTGLSSRARSIPPSLWWCLPAATSPRSAYRRSFRRSPPLASATPSCAA